MRGRVPEANVATVTAAALISGKFQEEDRPEEKGVVARRVQLPFFPHTEILPFANRGGSG